MADPVTSAKNDKPYRISFPRPIVLHGSSRKDLIERALEYLRQPGKLVIEEPPAIPDHHCPHNVCASQSCKDCGRIGVEEYMDSKK